MKPNNYRIQFPLSSLPFVKEMVDMIDVLALISTSLAEISRNVSYYSAKFMVNENM